MPTGKISRELADELDRHITERLNIERLRDSLIDMDILVDDARQELNAAAARLREAVRERDDLARALIDAVHVAGKAA